MPSLARFSLLIALLLAFALPVAWADDDPVDPPPVDADADPDADPDGDPAVEPEVEGRPVLHKVYVPFRDLSKVFEKENEGVFLPYEEFLDLWRRAHAVEGADQGPPVKAAVRAAAYEGTADGDMVSLDATLEIEVLAPGWQKIPLDFQGAGLEKALVDGKPALMVPAEKGYELLLKDVGRRTLTLSLRIAATRKGDQHTASFSLPPVPLSRLTLGVPGSATEVDVKPRLASTTRPATGGRTQLVAFLGPVDTLQITWRQKIDEGPRVEPLIFAEERHDVRADRGVLRSELVADLSILRAPLEALKIAVPADVVTLYVQGDGIRTWERSDDGKTIAVELREPVKDAWQLRLGLERPLPDLPADVLLPLAGLEGVERETGFLRLLMGEGVKLEPRETPGLLQVDVNELPDALKGAPPGRALAYRFPARPGSAKIRIESLEPRVTATVGTRVVIRPEGTDVRYTANLAVERSGIFGVVLDVPKDFEVTAVRVRGIEYDDHKVRDEADGARVLAVKFRDRLLGGAVVEVDGRRPTPLPPEEEQDSETEFTLPLPYLRGTDYVNGYLAVHVDGALEHRVITKENLVVLDAGAAAAVEPQMVEGVSVVLAYRFEHHEGRTAVELGLKRRAPAVMARVETFLRLEPDRTRLGTTIRYQVRYRGVDTMRFTAPLGVGARMHLDLEGAELLGPEPVEGDDPDDAERGLWTVKLPSPRTGEIPIVLEFEDVPEKALESGQSRREDLPTFVPLAEDGAPLPNTVHHVAVRRDPLLEAVPETLERAEEIDSRELPPSLRSDDNFLAFRAYDPTWAVNTFVTRHDYEPVADLVLSHLHLDTVLAKDGRATTEAYLVLRNNDRQSLRLKLPPEATIRAVTVDGKTRSPRQGEEGDEAVLIPLPLGLGKDEAFIVALAFDHAVSHSSSFGFDTTEVVSLEVLDDVDADLLTWRVWAPEDREYTSFGGTVEPAQPYRSWFATLVDRLFRTFGQRAQGRDVDVSRVVGGFTSPFATRHEGRQFLFSNRTGSGTVEVTGVEPGPFAFWKLFWFAVVLVGALLLAKAGGRAGLGEATVIAALILVFLVLLVRASPGTAQVLNAMLYGALVAGLLRLFVHGRRHFKARAAERAAQAAQGTDTPSEPPTGGDALPEGGAA